MNTLAYYSEDLIAAVVNFTIEARLLLIFNLPASFVIKEKSR
jgi:hypothetical protein